MEVKRRLNIPFQVTNLHCPTSFSQDFSGQYKRNILESSSEYRIVYQTISMYIILQQSRKMMRRMEQALNPDEYEATVSLTKEQKQQYLEQAYDNCINDYRHILERLAAS